MQSLLAILVILAQISFATFDVCYLDFQGPVEEFIPDPKGRTVSINVEQLASFRHANDRNLAGIECVLIMTKSGRRAFVVGSVRLVCEKFGIDLKDEACQQ